MVVTTNESKNQPANVSTKQKDPRAKQEPLFE